MGESTALITTVVLLVVVIAALAGVRFKYNNNVYGAEANAHAAMYKVFQEQVQSLNSVINSNMDKTRELQAMFEDANKYIQEVRRENERLHQNIASLRNQIKALGKEPVE